MCKYEIQDFKYIESESFESNFNAWLRMDTQERFNFNEEPLHPEEAYDMFVNLYGDKHGHNNVA